MVPGPRRERPPDLLAPRRPVQQPPLGEGRRTRSTIRYSSSARRAAAPASSATRPASRAWGGACIIEGPYTADAEALLLLHFDGSYAARTVRPAIRMEPASRPTGTVRRCLWDRLVYHVLRLRRQPEPGAECDRVLGAAGLGRQRWRRTTSSSRPAKSLKCISSISCRTRFRLPLTYARKSSISASLTPSTPPCSA